MRLVKLCIPAHVKRTCRAVAVVLLSIKTVWSPQQLYEMWVNCHSRIASQSNRPKSFQPCVMNLQSFGFWNGCFKDRCQVCIHLQLVAMFKATWSVKNMIKMPIRISLLPLYDQNPTSCQPTETSPLLQRCTLQTSCTHQSRPTLNWVGLLTTKCFRVFF